MGNSEAGILDYNRVAEKSAALFVDRIKVSKGVLFDTRG